MPDRVIPLYETTARQWIAQRHCTPFDAAWLERFALGLPDKGRVADLGCGNGVPMADMLLARGYRVTGIDTSETLIADARRRHGQAQWIEADMRYWSPGTRFDGILAWCSFFHLTPDDQRAMIDRFARLAARDAMLMFTSGPEAGTRIGEWQGESLYHASLSPETYRALLAAAGFHPIVHDLGHGDGEDPVVWLARYAG